MSSGESVEVTALAINVTIPELRRWTDTRRRERFRLTTLNVRLLPDGHLAVNLARGASHDETRAVEHFAAGAKAPNQRIYGRWTP